MHQERLELSDTTIDVVMKLSEGNPGALTVTCEVIKRGATIDPDHFMGGLGALISLDSFGIYGQRIWMLYKDVCGEDLVASLGVLRGCQMGFVGRETLDRAIDNRGADLDVTDVLARVRDALPRFGVTDEQPSHATTATSIA